MDSLRKEEMQREAILNFLGQFVGYWEEFTEQTKEYFELGRIRLRRKNSSGIVASQFFGQLVESWSKFVDQTEEYFELGRIKMRQKNFPKDSSGEVLSAEIS